MNNINLKNTIENLIDTFFYAGDIAKKISTQGVKITIKSDKSPVTDGDIEVDRILKQKIKSLTPQMPIISEETVDINKKNNFKDFWLIDPIDGTREYINKKKQYTLNAALIIGLIPVAGIIYAPALDRLFFSYGQDLAYEIFNGETKKLSCIKKNAGKIVGLENSGKTTAEVLNIYKEYKVSETLEMSSSLKFCTLAAGEADIYAANARAYEWDIAAGHAILVHAGGSMKTFEDKEFFYGKKNYKNLSLLAKRSDKLE